LSQQGAPNVRNQHVDKHGMVGCFEIGIKEGLKVLTQTDSWHRPSQQGSLLLLPKHEASHGSGLQNNS
jgi:hypothetical protein